RCHSLTRKLTTASSPPAAPRTGSSAATPRLLNAGTTSAGWPSSARVRCPDRRSRGKRRRAPGRPAAVRSPSRIARSSCASGSSPPSPCRGPATALPELPWKVLPPTDTSRRGSLLSHYALLDSRCLRHKSCQPSGRPPRWLWTCRSSCRGRGHFPEICPVLSRPSSYRPRRSGSGRRPPRPVSAHASYGSPKSQMLPDPRPSASRSTCPCRRPSSRRPPEAGSRRPFSYACSLRLRRRVCAGARRRATSLLAFFGKFGLSKFGCSQHSNDGWTVPSACAAIYARRGAVAESARCTDCGSRVGRRFLAKLCVKPATATAKPRR
ncbi:unnamed protein product, partial [Pelagomonas calceolata]